MCSPPTLSMSETILPPDDTTIALPPLLTIASAMSTVPRSTPPVSREGKICKIVAVVEAKSLFRFMLLLESVV